MLLVVVMGGSYMMWFSNGAPTTPETNETRLATYGEAIKDAKEVAGTVSGTVDNGGGVQVEVYAGLSFGDKTTAVDLSGRGLTGSLKAEVRMLQALTDLNLSNNKFTGLPAEVGQLSELKTLNLSGNPITGLPQELGNLSKLQTLDLRGTTYAKADLEIIKAKLPKTTTILVD